MHWNKRGWSSWTWSLAWCHWVVDCRVLWKVCVRSCHTRHLFPSNFEKVRGTHHLSNRLRSWNIKACRSSNSWEHPDWTSCQEEPEAVRGGWCTCSCSISSGKHPEGLVSCTQNLPLEWTVLFDKWKGTESLCMVWHLLNYFQSIPMRPEEESLKMWDLKRGDSIYQWRREQTQKNCYRQDIDNVIQSNSVSLGNFPWDSHLSSHYDVVNDETSRIHYSHCQKSGGICGPQWSSQSSIAHVEIN